MLKKVGAICLLLTLIAAPLLISASGAVVPYDHWLYSHFTLLYNDGLLPDYPAELIGKNRELTRYEMAYYLKGLLERLEAQQARSVSLDARQLLLLEECLMELKKELLALGVSIRSLDMTSLARSSGLETSENLNDPEYEYSKLSALTETTPDDPLIGARGPVVICQFSPAAPISYGLQRDIELHIIDTYYDPVSAALMPATFIAENAPHAVLQNTGTLAMPGKLGVQEAGLDAVFRADAFTNSKTSSSGIWTVSAGAGSSMGLVSSVALTDLYGRRINAMSIGDNGGLNGDHELSVGSATAQNTTQDLDMTLEIGRFVVSTNTPVGSIIKGIGLSGDAYGSLGLRTRYEYAQFGSLMQEPVSAAVAIEGKLVLGTATLYGGYGYSAVRQSVAEQFNLSQSITNAGINFRLSPDLQLFAEYVVLAPTQPWNQRQAVVGLQYSDLGSFMFGYRLLSLADSQLLASFSLKF